MCAVITNYNGLEHLPYSVPSMLATDWPNFKVIVVDDGSTDDSYRLRPGAIPTSDRA